MIAKPVTKESKDVTKPKSTEQATKVINSQSEMAVEYESKTGRLNEDSDQTDIEVQSEGIDLPKTPVQMSVKHEKAKQLQAELFKQPINMKDITKSRISKL